MKFGIQNAYLGKGIHVGRLSKDGKTFLEKQDVTPEAFYAMAQFTKEHLNSDGFIDVGGLRIEIKVTDSPDPEQGPPSNEGTQHEGRKHE